MRRIENHRALAFLRHHGVEDLVGRLLAGVGICIGQRRRLRLGGRCRLGQRRRLPGGSAGGHRARRRLGQDEGHARQRRTELGGGEEACRLQCAGGDRLRPVHDDAVGLGGAVDALGNFDRAGDGRIERRRTAGTGEAAAGQVLMGKLLCRQRQQQAGEEKAAEPQPASALPLALSPPYDHALLHLRN